MCEIWDIKRDFYSDVYTILNLEKSKHAYIIPSPWNLRKYSFSDQLWFYSRYLYTIIDFCFDDVDSLP